MKQRSLFLSLALVMCTAVFAAIEPSVTLTDYYADANGKSGQELRLALRAAIDHHTNITYNNVGYIMKYADTKDADGKHLIDIYSDFPYSTSNTNKDGKANIDDEKCVWISGGEVGEGLNREHTVPQSWFGKKDPMVADVFHIYPTDAHANNHRSSHLYGEVYPKGSGSTWSHDGYSEYGALGNTYKDATDLANSKYTYDGKEYTLVAYSGTVYEPKDEFKGDLARGIFYMATRYASPETNDGTDCSTWQNKSNPSHFGGGTDDKFGLTPYTVALLLKWHRQDPVSEKELLRNEVIYGNTKYNKSNYKQGNRNPFIDYPELVEYIWGTKAGQTVTVSALTSAYTGGSGGGGGGGGGDQPSTDPVIEAPTSVTIDTEPYEKGEKSFTISFANLTTGPTIELTGTDKNNFDLYTYADGEGGWDWHYDYSTTLSQTTGSVDVKIEFELFDWDNKSQEVELKITAGTTSKTVTIKGESAFKQTVEWYADGILIHKDVVLNNTKVSALPTAPSAPEECSSKVFVGWCPYEIETEQDSKPLTLYTKVEDVPAFYNQYYSETHKMYAVFAMASGAKSGTESYEKVTKSAGLLDGQYLIVYEAGNVAFDGSRGSEDPKLDAASNYFGVTIADGKIAKSTDTEASYFTINVTKGTIKSKSGKYIGNSGDTNFLNVSDDEQTNTISIATDGSATILAAGGSYLRYNASSGQTRFRYFKSGTYTSQKAIALYRLTSGGETTYKAYSTRCGSYYNITFKYGDGTDEKYEIQCREGVTPECPYGVYKSMTDAYEFEFDSWDPAPVPATQNATYNAVFDTIVRTYPVLFMITGADVQPQYVPWGGHVAEPAVEFWCSARHLEGWYKDPSYTSKFNFATETINSQEILMLNGKTELSGKVVYIVEHDHTFGTEVILEYDTIDYTIPSNQELEEVNITLVPRTYTGYTCNSPVNVILQLCQDTSHFSLFYTPNYHNLSWDANNGTLEDEDHHDFSQTSNLPYGTHFAYPTILTGPTGYRFDHWEPAFTLDAKNEPYMPDKDVTYKAIWVKKQYTVTVEPNNPAYGTATVTGNTTFFEEDMDDTTFKLTFEAKPANSYCEFEAWIDKSRLSDKTAEELVAMIKADYATTTDPIYKQLLGGLLTAKGTLNGATVKALFDNKLIIPDAKGNFALQAVFKSSKPTDIELQTTNDQRLTPQKVLINGQFYILHNGKLFNATGKLVE